MTRSTSIVAKDDVWGLPLAQLCVGLGYVRTGGDGVDLLAEAADGFAAVGAPVLEAWARSGHALATALSVGAGASAQSEARKALGLLRSASLNGPVVIAASAAAIADPGHAARHRVGRRGGCRRDGAAGRVVPRVVARAGAGRR